MNSCLRSTFTFSKGCDVFLHHLRNSTGPKGTPLEYFRLWDFFWKKFTKGPPLSVFSAWWDFFQFLFHKRFPNSPIFWHFEVLLLFLSFRYGTDLGRSRVVCHDHITKLDSGWVSIYSSCINFQKDLFASLKVPIFGFFGTVLHFKKKSINLGIFASHHSEGYEIFLEATLRFSLILSAFNPTLDGPLLFFFHSAE